MKLENNQAITINSMEHLERVCKDNHFTDSGEASLKADYSDNDDGRLQYLVKDSKGLYITDNHSDIDVGI